MFHKRLLKEFKDNMKYVFGVVATQWIMLLANVLFVFESARLLDTIRLGSTSAANIQRYAIIAAVVFLVRIIMAKLSGSFSFQAAVNTKNQLRMRLYDKMLRLGPDYHEKCSTSEVVQLSTEGVEQLEIYFGRYVPQFFYAFLAPITLFVIVGTMNIPAALVLLVCVPLIPGAIMGVQKFAKKIFSKYWGSYTELGDHFLEYIQGLTTMKIYQADEYYAKKMHEESEQFRKMTMRVLVMQLNSITIMDLVAYGGAVAGIIVGLLSMKAGNVSFVEGIFIILISAEFFLPMRLLGSFFHISMNGNGAADKIFGILDLPEETDGKIEKIEDDTISFKNIDFAYPSAKERKVLHDVSFQVKPHTFVAFAGESGCGKSTVASLLMGEQADFAGEILLGGHALHDIKSRVRYEKITRINHNSYLFAGTVRDNLQMGNSMADDEAMNEALRTVRLYDFIHENGGLDMAVIENADNMSGGQKQRLVLARAILHDSDIYIFDEATSNIDVESEEMIMQTVKQMAKEKTIILISHRLANITEADEIFMMEEGSIAEHGTHEELLRSGKGIYRKLYEGQKKLEEYTVYREKVSEEQSRKEAI
ncbi:ABC transporter ATP-binding protein/permease [Konateibacter massiliensis]|uniref:ABC transporter ATP-binding protein/permease n=1 Tax=Konateibacter massiliensis TaxID=2002841 RepID=UPI000C161C89|nr:ABC transporter ATP-binding protein/permease [Konateibacter massiliensis]